MEYFRTWWNQNVFENVSTDLFCYNTKFRTKTQLNKYLFKTMNTCINIFFYIWVIFISFSNKGTKLQHLKFVAVKTYYCSIRLHHTIQYNKNIQQQKDSSTQNQKKKSITRSQNTFYFENRGNNTNPKRYHSTTKLATKRQSATRQRPIPMSKKNRPTTLKTKKPKIRIPTAIERPFSEKRIRCIPADCSAI